MSTWEEDLKSIFVVYEEGLFSESRDIGHDKRFLPHRLQLNQALDLVRIKRDIIYESDIREDVSPAEVLEYLTSSVAGPEGLDWVVQEFRKVLWELLECHGETTQVFPFGATQIRLVKDRIQYTDLDGNISNIKQRDLHNIRCFERRLEFLDKNGDLLLKTDEQDPPLFQLKKEAQAIMDRLL